LSVRGSPTAAATTSGSAIGACFTGTTVATAGTAGTAGISTSAPVPAAGLLPLGSRHRATAPPAATLSAAAASAATAASSMLPVELGWPPTRHCRRHRHGSAVLRLWLLRCVLGMPFTLGLLHGELVRRRQVSHLLDLRRLAGHWIQPVVPPEELVVERLAGGGSVPRVELQALLDEGDGRLDLLHLVAKLTLE
jgi:hypothetical protein